MKESFYKDVVEKSHNGFAYHKIICDDHGLPVDYEFVEINIAFEKLTGLKGSDIIGQTFSSVFPEKKQDGFDWIHFYGDIAINNEEKEIVQYSEVLDQWFKVSAYSPQKYFFITIFSDLPHRSKDLEELTDDTLTKSEKRYQDYIENAPEGVFVVDKKGQYIEVNRAATEMTGYSSEALLKMSIADFSVEKSQDKAMELFKSTIEMGKTSGELQYKHKNGSIRWWRINAVKLTEDRYICFSSDITEKKKAEADLVYYGYHDYLTGLYNRRFFVEALISLDTEINYPLSIFICDINGLKLYNDSFGLDMGDELLKKVAEKIIKACRSGDIVCRIGGGEFAVILKKTDIYETIRIANNIKMLVSKEKVINLDLSISYGCGTKVTNEQLVKEVLTNAENHMYRQKLYERYSKRNKAIELIMNALFEKSNIEAAHSERVSYICEAIAAEMNFDEDAINKMRIAGLVHDIGKISIEERILNKPGRLSVDEMKKMQTHSESGWRILSASNESEDLAQFVLDHHEKWDGSGYPKGLKAEEIPVESRIISIADAYDAMTGTRSYKKALDKETAIKELKRCSGSHFDPEIVNTFVNEILSSGDDL